MANLDNPNGFKAVMNLGGGAIPLFSVEATSNVSIQCGDALVMLSNGTVNVATATSAAILGVSQSKITAIAATRQTINYVPALPSIVFSGQCSGTMTPVNLGEDVDIEGTTGIMEINEDAQSINVVRVLSLDGHQNNAWGANARALFVWSNSQFTGQA